MAAGTPWVIQPLNCEIRNTQPLKQEPGKTIEYEAHVGMAQEEGRIGTYREFADITLKHIKEAGYNTIQLMATMEHLIMEALATKSLISLQPVPGLESLMI